MNTQHGLSKQRYPFIAGIVLAATLVGLPFVSGTRTTAESLPAQLTDQQFWKMSSEFSEPDGTFRSDNLLSNETWYQYVIPDLLKTAKPGRVYLGVGPEQNFTYIAAVKPRMAFIIDIRRGNLDLQLMYKALFELSRDRVEFVSRLFSKKAPAGLSQRSTAREIFTAFETAETSEALYKETQKAIEDLLTKKHALPLPATDISGIQYVYNAFYQYGPDINYSSTTGGFGGGGRASYEDLMTETDGVGTSRSYLATHDNFMVLKDLESKNLIVPVVGNFAGPKAIRSVAKYLKETDTSVSAFYLSNVEQFLYQDGIWKNFCSSTAMLPLDQYSMFIRSVRGGRYGQSFGLSSDLGNMVADLKGCSTN
jgi:hypothetical protein